MKSKRNITPSSGSTSSATSLILIHKNAHPCPVNYLDMLVDLGSRHAASASPKSQLLLPNVMLDLSKFLILPL